MKNVCSQGEGTNNRKSLKGAKSCNETCFLQDVYREELVCNEGAEEDTVRILAGGEFLGVLPWELLHPLHAACRHGLLHELHAAVVVVVCCTINCMYE